MRKLLPKNGFTLIELMVTISIIAILSMVGITLFLTAQKSARDGRRRADIDAIAAALETNHVPNSTTYPALAGSMFASFSSGVAVPTDSGNVSATYSVAVSTTVGAGAPAVPTAWTTGVASPSAPAGYTPIVAGNPPATATAWTVCAQLENPGTGTAWYCKQSTQ